MSGLQVGEYVIFERCIMNRTTRQSLSVDLETYVQAQVQLAKLCAHYMHKMETATVEEFLNLPGAEELIQLVPARAPMYPGSQEQQAADRELLVYAFNMMHNTCFTVPQIESYLKELP